MWSLDIYTLFGLFIILNCYQQFSVLILHFLFLGSVITFRDMPPRWRSFYFLLAVSVIMFIIGYNKVYIPHYGSWSKSGFDLNIPYQNGDSQPNKARKQNLTHLEFNNGTLNRHQNKNPFIQFSQQSHGQPMVLSLEMWEQTGMALQNLFELQCWASSVNISQVMEPSICSNGNHTFDFGCQSDFNFRNLFDINYWNQISLKQKNSILVSNSSLQNASKEIIFVQLKYVQSNIMFKCKSLDELAGQYWFIFFKRNGFNISTVCIEFPISDSNFRKKIFGSTNAAQRNKTVIFDEWRGLRKEGHWRAELSGSRCGKGLTTTGLVNTRPPAIRYPPFRLSPLLPSKKVIGYINRFLSEHMHGEQYVVVMIRSEHLNLNPKIFHSTEFEDCIKEITSDYKKALDRMNGTKTLVFTDSGKYGSHSMKKDNVDRYSQYLLDHLDPELSLEQMDSSFEDITGSKDSTLMAFFQSSLAARANCVLFLGGGSFQRLTLGNYAYNHRGQECYYFRSRDCTPQYIKIVY